MTVLPCAKMSRSVLAFVSISAVMVASCTAGEADPSTGTYTVAFPSVAAAVSTDTVQLFLFDPPASGADRINFCQNLIAARKRGDALRPTSAPASPVNICELLLGRKPVTLPYGEKAILAVAQRKAKDVMIGCTIQTIGSGNALLPIPLALIDVAVPVPETTCLSVGDFCDRKCQ